jgi:catechol 2,3-dioxygenase-like lactoylglutathione lyase family enzyme
MTVALNGIAHIQLSVKDPDRCIPFWEKLCHFFEMKTLIKNEDTIYCIGSRTGILVRGAPEDKRDRPFDQDRPGLHHICFRAREAGDIDAIHRYAVDELGAKIVHPPEDGSQFAPGYYSVLFEDPRRRRKTRPWRRRAAKRATLSSREDGLTPTQLAERWGTPSALEETIETCSRQKIGRYVFLVGSQGFEIRESSNFLTRLIGRLMGRTDDVKLRLGLFEGRPGTHPTESIGDVVVHKRRLVGPEAKATALRRRWEVRVWGAEGAEVSVFFRFRDEAQAQHLADGLRRELAALRNAFGIRETPRL